MALKDTETVIARLVADFGYPSRGATAVAVRLGQLTQPLADQADRWWSDGSPIPLEVDGFTVSLLQANHGLTPIAAILTLDWLIREPDKARAQLARGHDSVQ